jgi:hydrogenase/urease accessory protein HupE
MGQIVYFLCAITSLGCTVLLINRYRKARIGLLFWSAVAFLAFTITNILLFIDLVLVPNMDLSVIRNVITLGGVLVMVYGLIREATR